MFNFGRNKNVEQQNQQPILSQQSEVFGEKFQSDFQQQDTLKEKTKVYNPYESLGMMDGRQMKQFKILNQPEFVFQEEAKQKRRGWSENLTFYTGVGALGGASIGGSYGIYTAVQGLRQQQVTSTQPRTPRIIANRLLNSVVGSGKIAGNTFGVLGLYFSSFESFFMYATRDYYFIPENLNTVAAGFATGALFRSFRGLRPATITGLVGAFIGAAIVQGRQYFHFL